MQAIDFVKFNYWSPEEIDVSTLIGKGVSRKLVSAMDLLSRDVKEIPCLVEPFLQKTGLACVAGSSDTGKSAFLRYLTMCVVTGKSNFLGYRLNAPRRRAIYVSSEDDDTATAFLLQKQNNGLQSEIEGFKGLDFIFDTEDILTTLDKELAATPADVVIIDAFGDLYGKDMNKANEVRTFLQEFQNLATKYSCLFLFLHHCGKGKEDGRPSKNNLLGSQGFEAKMRAVLELRSDPVSDDAKHLCIVKGNYLPPEYKGRSYQLNFDENMTFENTGKRVSFELLKADAGREKYEQIKTYRAQGLTLEQIAPMVGYGSKSAVSKFMSKYDVSTTFPKETEGNNTGNTEIADYLQ